MPEQTESTELYYTFESEDSEFVNMKMDSTLANDSEGVILSTIVLAILICLALLFFLSAITIAAIVAIPLRLI